MSNGATLGEIDYASFNKKSQKFTGFVWLIDSYNRFIFVERIIGKSNEELEKPYKALFNKSGSFNTGIPHLVLIYTVQKGLKLLKLQKL